MFCGIALKQYNIRSVQIVIFLFIFCFVQIHTEYSKFQSQLITAQAPAVGSIVAPVGQVHGKSVYQITKLVAGI